MRPGWRLSPERMREVREQRGYSRMQLAQRMGVRMEAIRNWELGNNKITMDNLMLLATALDCDPGEFFVKLLGLVAHES